LSKLNTRIENAKSAKDLTTLSTTHSKYLKAVQKANEAEAKVRERLLAEEIKKQAEMKKEEQKRLKIRQEVE
jgi:hypothetical protein